MSLPNSLPNSLYHYRNLTLPVTLEAWNLVQTFLKVYTYHSWRSKSSRLHSGIKNVLQDSLEDALETQWIMSSSSASRDLKFYTELPYHLYMPFLTSKVIWTPLRNQEYPPRFLGGRSGDTKENILFKCTMGPEILHRSSLMFIHVILDVHSHLYSILESRLSSKTPWRLLWRLKWECPPVHL